MIQTLFYGVFSAWVLWHKENPPRTNDFRWREAGFYLGVPVIQVLFDEIAKPGNLRNLDLVEVLDWTGNVLNRIVRQEFFARFDEGQAVQYFYEPFLQQFDPELRKQLGVWYTPQEIVKYMVARVDTVLKEELNLADGLADPNVYVLDPCCGTGAYLVEVLNHIHQTLEQRGEGALAAEDLKKAATERVFGFEILPAPFVVAHLQLGLLLNNLGANIEEGERVGVYLTNALTGWEPAKEPKTHLLFPEMEAERDQAETIKRETPILVIIGNPPYNAFAGTSPAEEQGLVEPYKAGLIKKWGIKKFNLDELYVRFFRLAERRIAEMGARKGVVCYISNFSYLRDPSFVVMREKFLREFDLLWFDSLNGDSRETGKVTPEGKPDPSVFSTEYNREGIRVGTAIGLMVRKEQRDEQPTVRFRQFWGVNKREELLSSVEENGDAGHLVRRLDPNWGVEKSTESESVFDYQNVSPQPESRFSFYSSDVKTNYFQWALLTELCEEKPAYGHMETRGLSLISMDEAKLRERVQKFFDATVSNQEMEKVSPELMAKYSRYYGHVDRAKIQQKMKYADEHIRKFYFKPFDSRFSYADAQRPLWSEPSTALTKHAWKGNSFLISRVSGVREPEGTPMYFATSIFERDVISGHARAIPLQINIAYVLDKKSTLDFGFSENITKANFSEKARAYLAAIGVENVDASAEKAGLIWMHALAVGYAPLYLEENADGIRADFPRVPLPAEIEVLQTSASLGKEVAALLDTENPVVGVTAGNLLAPFARIGVPAKTDGTNLQAADYEVRANWGYGGRDGAVTMPGKGKTIVRDYSAQETEAIEQAAARLGYTPEQILACLGAQAVDVYLNDAAFWRCVPQRVWEYTIGGYQVMKKWLSYREFAVLGRALTADEVREVMNMARRLTALVLLEPKLNENYAACKNNSYEWNKV
ncbi:MAG TPA: type ISP restriction/modification enzyme [Pyrinomonadaceae bacterium]